MGTEGRLDPLGLLAEGPSRARGAPPADRLGLYSWLIGEWDFDCEYYREDGGVERASGEWLFSWALEGRAIVDLWTYPTRSERESTGAGPGGLGVTVRTYDAKADSWRVAWSAANGRCLLFKGNRAGDEIVQEGEEEGRPLRWVFFEIREDSFSWRAESPVDGGAGWRRNQLMRVRRRADSHA